MLLNQIGVIDKTDLRAFGSDFYGIQLRDCYYGLDSRNINRAETIQMANFFLISQWIFLELSRVQL